MNLPSPNHACNCDARADQKKQCIRHLLHFYMASQDQMRADVDHKWHAFCKSRCAEKEYNEFLVMCSVFDRHRAIRYALSQRLMK